MKEMGEKKTTIANQHFTFLIIVNVIVGIIMSIVGYLCMNSLFNVMSVSADVLNYTKEYLSYYLLFTIPILLMNNFSLYLIANGKSNISFICSVLGGIVNIILDYLLIGVLGIGIKGAAIATGLGYSVTTFVGFIIFSNNKSLLHFTKPSFSINTLKKAISNGSSEMASSLVSGITTLVFNALILKYVGEDGIAAITIIMYVLMFVSSLFSGYSYGVAPLISFYYGENNTIKLKQIIRKSFKIIACISLISFITSIIITKPLVSIFVSSDSPVYTLATNGNTICSIALLFNGFNIFTSSMFTALNNGLISAILAFSRSFVFMIVCLLILPLLFNVTGIWLANPAAELLAIALSIFMIIKYKKSYAY